MTRMTQSTSMLASTLASVLAAVLAAGLATSLAGCPSEGEGEGEGDAAEGEGDGGEGEGEGEGEGAEGEGEGEGAEGEGEGEGEPPGDCGDGQRTRGEECDDGNNVDGDGCDGGCHLEPIAGQSDAQDQALAAINALRASVDLPGAHLDAALDQSSQAHADYFVNNADAYSGGLSPHEEDASFPDGFTGVQFFNRMSAAGYAGQPLFEVMAFVDDPNEAVAEWFNTVLHRIPLVHPNTRDLGYGGARSGGRAADVVDFGAGSSADPHQVVLVPPPGATGVAPSFSGNEGPQPPAPPRGAFPSGPIVSVLFDRGVAVTLTRHDIVDDAGNTLDVTFVDASNQSVGAFMQNSVAFYADGPAPSGAVFHVFVEGTVGGQPFSESWSFTVR